MLIWLLAADEGHVHVHVHVHDVMVLLLLLVGRNLTALVPALVPAVVRCAAHVCLKR